MGGKWLGKRVAVLLGGLSTEREVSLDTGREVVKALESKGYTVVPIDVGLDLPARLQQEACHVAFNALHGRLGEDGCVQGLLESIALPYTGSGVLASAVAMDKPMSLAILAHAGLTVPPYLLLRPEDLPAFREQDMPFGLPVVIKPTREGSSVGITIVQRPEDLRPALDRALKAQIDSHVAHHRDIMVEPYIAGPEVTVGVLGDQVLGAIQVVAAGQFYDYQAKYVSHDTKYLLPPPLEEGLLAQVLDVGLRAHRTLGCGGVTRTDTIIDEGGRINVLEVNTLPGMTSTSLVPKMAAYKGIAFADLIEVILDQARLWA